MSDPKPPTQEEEMTEEERDARYNQECNDADNKNEAEYYNIIRHWDD